MLIKGLKKENYIQKIFFLSYFREKYIYIFLVILFIRKLEIKFFLTCNIYFLKRKKENIQKNKMGISTIYYIN